MPTPHRRSANRINASDVQRYDDEGLRFNEMPARFKEETGLVRTAARFAQIAAQHGIPAAQPRLRHDETLPWRVHAKHSSRYEARMLRYLGRRLKGLENPPTWDARLNAFLLELHRAGAVVHYDPDTEQGFFWVPREIQDGERFIRRPVEP